MEDIRKRGVSVLLAALVLVGQFAALGVAPVAACDRSANAEVVSHLGGSRLNKVVSAGDGVSLVAAGGALLVFDVADAAAPKLLSQVPLPGEAEDVAYAGGFAYVVGDWGEMQIVDLTDASAPKLRGATGWGSAMHGVAVSGDRVFVTSDGHGFKMVDVGDKDAPYLVAYYGPPSEGQYYDIALSGTKAYVSWGASAENVRFIRAFDVSDLDTTPRKLGDYEVSGTGVSVNAIAAAGSFVYAAEAARGLEVVDFSSASAPTREGLFEVVGLGGSDVTLAGGYAYLACGDAGLKILDVSDPSAVDGVATGDVAAMSVAVKGGVASVSNGSAFLTLDVSNPAAPSKGAAYSTMPRDARDVAVSGDFAYVAAGDEGVLKVDITDPETPEIVGKAAGIGIPSRIAVLGTTAFVADQARIVVLDLGPADPVELTRETFGAPIEDLKVDGNRLYAACGEAGLLIFDVSDRTQLKLIGTLKADTVMAASRGALMYDEGGGQPLGPIHAVAAQGQRVFIGIDGGNIVSLDAANAASIRQLDRMETYGDVLSLSLDGERLWAGTSEKVYAVNVADRTAISQAGNYYYFGYKVTDIAGKGPYAFACTEKGFYLLDFSDVSNPYVNTDFGEGSQPMGGVDVTAEGRLFLAARDAGLYELAVPVFRTAGPSRYDTAVEMSEANWKTAPCVVIATGANYADAACAGPLAHALGAPLLLTKGTLPSSVAREIKRLGAKRAIIVGASKVVPSAVVTGLVNAGIPKASIERIGGWSRFDTARLVADRLVKALGHKPSAAFVATGEDFPDALSVSSVAGKMEAPVLLVRRSDIPTPSAAAVRAMGYPKLVAVGGTSAVSGTVYSKLKCVKRLYGPGRWDTAKAVAEYALSHGFTPRTALVTSGLNFPDALVSGVVAAKRGEPVLLVRSDVPDATSRFIQRHAVSKLTVVGSAGAVSQSVEDQLVDLLAAQ